MLQYKSLKECQDLPKLCDGLNVNACTGLGKISFPNIMTAIQCVNAEVTDYIRVKYLFTNCQSVSPGKMTKPDAN